MIDSNPKTLRRIAHVQALLSIPRYKNEKKNTMLRHVFSSTRVQQHRPVIGLKFVFIQHHSDNNVITLLHFYLVESSRSGRHNRTPAPNMDSTHEHKRMVLIPRSVHKELLLVLVNYCKILGSTVTNSSLKYNHYNIILFLKQNYNI